MQNQNEIDASNTGNDAPQEETSRCDAPDSGAWSRKQFLQRAGLAGAGLALGSSFEGASAAGQQNQGMGSRPAPNPPETGLAPTARDNRITPDRITPNHVTSRMGLLDHEVDVRGFGARGDGKTDDTKAFQNAIAAISARGGGTVFVPAGRYLIASHLELEPHVVLRGVLEAPGRFGSYAADQSRWGSILLAVGGAGNPDGTPFITMHAESTLRGITIFHPNQKSPVPTPYPWTVRGRGDNISLLDCLLANPYQAVDFGTNPCGRHFIENLYAHPLYRGLFVDKCYDVGRIHNVHFWPFYHGDRALFDWTRENGVAFMFGRTDWEYVSNCFCIFYKIGFHFAAFSPDGPGNVVLINSGSDDGPLAVQVDAVQAHSGISFTNGQIMSRVNVAPTNRGPVKFTACGFWGWGKTDHHAVLEGRGRVSFDNCHFTDWAQNTVGAAAIVARRGTLGVSNCEFLDGGKTQFLLEENLRAANIVGCHFRGATRIENRSRGEVQIGLNTDEKPAPPLALRPRFSTGFENGQPQPRTDVFQVAPRAERRGNYSLGVVRGQGRGGGNALLFRGGRLSGEEASGHGAIYHRIFGVHIPVMAQTVLRFWMRADGEEARRTSIDLLLDNGPPLRDTPAVDREDRRLHPADTRGEVGVWTRIETRIGEWIAGKTITAILVAHDGGGRDPFEVAFDDIEIGETP